MQYSLLLEIRKEAFMNCDMVVLCHTNMCIIADRIVYRHFQIHVITIPPQIARIDCQCESVVTIKK